jgi:hypothetical protein
VTNRDDPHATNAHTDEPLSHHAALDSHDAITVSVRMPGAPARPTADALFTSQEYDAEGGSDCAPSYDRRLRSPESQKMGGGAARAPLRAPALLGTAAVSHWHQLPARLRVSGMGVDAPMPSPSLGGQTPVDDVHAAGPGVRAQPSLASLVNLKAQ